MSSQKIEIKCKEYGPVTDADDCDDEVYDIEEFYSHLIITTYSDYNINHGDNKYEVEVKFDNASIILHMANHKEDELDVCLLGITCELADGYLSQLKKWTTKFISRYPSTPIILYGYVADVKYSPDDLKTAILDGCNLINRTSGQKIAREIGAVKYIECNPLTGRGAKILIDEIVFAGLGKRHKEREKSELSQCTCDVL